MEEWQNIGREKVEIHGTGAKIVRIGQSAIMKHDAQNPQVVSCATNVNRRKRREAVKSKQNQ